MPAPYPYPNGTVSFTDVVQYLNNDVLQYQGYGILGITIVGLIFFITITATLSKTNDPLLSAGISSMLCFVISVLMVYLSMAGSFLAWLFLLLTMVTIALMYFRNP